jgi:hypothetical protein
MTLASSSIADHSITYIGPVQAKITGFGVSKMAIGHQKPAFRIQDRAVGRGRGKKCLIRPTTGFEFPCRGRCDTAASQERLNISAHMIRAQHCAFFTECGRTLSIKCKIYKRVSRRFFDPHLPLESAIRL